MDLAALLRRRPDGASNAVRFGGCVHLPIDRNALTDRWLSWGGRRKNGVPTPTRPFQSLEPGCGRGGHRVSRLLRHAGNQQLDLRRRALTAAPPNPSIRSRPIETVVLASGTGED